MDNLSAIELREKIINKEVKVIDVVEKYLKNIDERDSEINAFITVFHDRARLKANELDKKIASGEKLGELCGLPIAIKDNISIKDEKMTCASKMLENYISPYDASVIEKIESEDGIIIGKVNMDEFAMGSDTKTSYYGVVKNPLNTKLVAGGSSGGSAAAVAAEESILAVGTDTGGSVRQPASFCGLVGMKPTYGSISRFGVSTMANTFDQVGVFANNVKDAYLLLKSMTGRDIKDATSLGNPSIEEEIVFEEDYLNGLKIALPKAYAEMELVEPIKSEFENAISLLKSKGAVVETVEMDSLKYVLETYHILVNGEIAPNMARFDGLVFGNRAKDYDTVFDMYTKSRSDAFGDEVKRRIMIGTHILSLELSKDYYEKALKLRAMIIDDFNKIFKDYDLILSPTTPTLAFPIDRDMEPVEIYKADLFTVPVNIAGLPAISVPMPKKEGLSVGIQFIGNRFKDDIVIKCAENFERSVK